MIDTSTTKGKIQVMQAFKDGEAIQGASRSMNNWGDAGTPCWNWEKFDWRIKPQTVEEAANNCEAFSKYTNGPDWRKVGFIAGAQWQKEQSNE